ncbi:MAG: hypothetical protein WCK55_20150, partial [Verrucomicrobiota bacterium]
ILEPPTPAAVQRRIVTEPPLSLSRHATSVPAWYSAPPPKKIISGILCVIIFLGFTWVTSSHSDYKKGYNLGFHTGADFANSAISGTVPLDNYIKVDMALKHLFQESDEFKRGYKEGAAAACFGVRGR